MYKQSQNWSGVQYLFNLHFREILKSVCVKKKKKKCFESSLTEILKSVCVKKKKKKKCFLLYFSSWLLHRVYREKQNITNLMHCGIEKRQNKSIEGKCCPLCNPLMHQVLWYFALEVSHSNSMTFPGFSCPHDVMDLVTQENSLCSHHAVTEWWLWHSFTY